MSLFGSTPSRPRFGNLNINNTSQENKDGVVSQSHTTQSRKTGAHSFESLINDTRFSDIKVIVGAGPETSTYSLHRNILANRSEYFNRSLDSKWKEAKDGEIRLPESHPQAFRAVLTWIYGGAFRILEHKNYLAEIYKVADYLQIRDFKDLFLSQLVSAIEESGSRRQSSTQCHIPGPYTLLGALLGVAPKGDHPTLQKLADMLTAKFDVPWDDMYALATAAQDCETINITVLLYMIAKGLDGPRKASLPPGGHHVSNSNEYRDIWSP